MISDVHQIRKAIEIVCPVCKADIGCLCDQFTAPAGLPFHVHDERFVKADQRGGFGKAIAAYDIPVR